MLPGTVARPRVRNGSIIKVRKYEWIEKKEDGNTPPIFVIGDAHLHIGKEEEYR